MNAPASGRHLCYPGSTEIAIDKQQSTGGDLLMQVVSPDPVSIAASRLGELPAIQTAAYWRATPMPSDAKANIDLTDGPPAERAPR